MKYLTILKTIVAMLPIIIDAVKVVESAIPGAGQGAAKLAAVRALLESVSTVATDLGASFSDLWPALEKVIGGVVSAFNAAGTFKAPAASNG